MVFDDADSIFMDDVSLNLLKKACDSTETRHISWLAETKMETDEGEALPTHFEFEGSIIYITNLDFDRMVASGNKLSKHVQALESRAIYLDLTMKTRKDYMVRIKQVLKRGMAEKLGISKEKENVILTYMDDNSQRLRELSLRTVVKLAKLMNMSPASWKILANATCLK